MVLKTLKMSLEAVYFAHGTGRHEHAACKISRRVREILQPQYHPIWMQCLMEQAGQES